MSTNIDIGNVLTRAFDLYKKNMGTLILANLLAGLIGAFTIGILAGPMYAGLVLIVLGLIDGKQPAPGVGDVFSGFQYFVPALLFVIGWFIASFLGQMILGILPLIGFPLSIAYSMALGTVVMFTLFNIVDRKLDLVPAVQASYETVKANFWPFLGVYVVASVISSLGIIACFIGVILTAPMLVCMVAIAYRDSHPAAAAPAPQA